MSGVLFTSFPTSPISRFTRPCFGCSCSVGSGFPSLLPHTSAGAAVLSTFVAITGLLALWLECLGGEETF